MKVLASSIAARLFENPEWVNALSQLGLFVLALITGTGILRYRKQVAHWLSWIRLKYFPIWTFNIALSIESEKGGMNDKYVDEIKRELLRLIEEYNLSKEIVIKDFGDIKVFKNKQEAEAYRQSKELDLIIWGRISPEGLKKEGKEISEVQLHFTIGHPKDEANNIGKMVLTELAGVLAARNYWTIIDNSIDDIKVINKNIFDFSLYVLGLSLLLFGRIEKSMRVFEILAKRIGTVDDSFSKGVKFHLVNIYTLLMEEDASRKNWKVSRVFAQKTIEYEPKNLFALVRLAICEYLLGNSEKSEETVVKLQSLYPQDPVSWLDVAFIRVTQRKYYAAFKQYQKLKIPTEKLTFNPLEVIEFLDTQYETDKEPAYKYATGFLNYYHADKGMAKNDFEEFIKLCDKKAYKYMYNDAQRLLKMVISTSA